MQTIILAGGFGTRLQQVVKDVPKPMAEIDERPFLHYLITYLKKYNLVNLIISVGYKKEKIMSYFGENYLGSKIAYASEDQPLGTGGAIVNSLQHLDSNQPFMVINGDTFLKIDYQKLINFHLQNNADLTVVLRHMDDCSRYGNVVIDKQNLITNFEEKSSTKKSGYINGGIYIINPGLLDKMNLGQSFSFETDFLCKNVKKSKFCGFVADDYFIDIGVPNDYYRARLELYKIING